MLYIPMVFMMAVTFTALSMTIYTLGTQFMTTGLSLGMSLQLVFAVLLLALGLVVAVQGIRALRGKPVEVPVFEEQELEAEEA